MLRIDQLRLLPDEPEDVLLHKCARLLRVAPSALTGLTVLRRAIDARESLTFVYTVAVSAPQEAALLRITNPEASLSDLARLAMPPVSKSCLSHRLKKLMSLDIGPSGPA